MVEANKSVKPKRPQVYNYTDYRAFLRDFYTFLKQTRLDGFSYREFSAMAQFKSTAVLKQVIDGKRNFAANSCMRVAAALGLNKLESEYFLNLTLMSQATTHFEKQFYASRIVKSSFYTRARPVEQATFRYLANWYNVAIRELVHTKNFKEDPEWIARRLKPNITPAQAKRALKDLEVLQLIKRNSKGKIEQTDSMLTTTDDVSSIPMRDFHKQMIELARESIERFPVEKRNVSSVTLGLSKTKVQEVTELIKNFRRELLVIAGKSHSSEDVYQVNFQIFPLTEDEVAG